MSSVVPIGAMFAMTLWLGNTAYLYISVAFAQMLKAISMYEPVVFISLLVLSVPTFSKETLPNVELILLIFTLGDIRSASCSIHSGRISWT